MRLVEGRMTRARSAPFSQTIQLSQIGIELRYSSEEMRDLMAPAFRHLEHSSAPSLTFQVFDCDEFVLVGSDGEAFDVVERAIAAVWLKGMILEAVLAHAAYLAALHSACVVGREGAVLLVGPPGAGKTTLTLALLQQGYRYGSDDVTLVSTDATVCGVALAPAVKESAWNIAKRLGRDLSQAAVYLRPDDQQVRFVEMTHEELGTSSRVGSVLLLRRTAEGAAALKPIATADTLAELLREARSPNGRCSAEVIHVLSDILRDAHCFELQYSEAEDAARLISESARR